MNIAMLEELMYQVSGLLLPPVLLIITFLFFYAFFVLGVFAAQFAQRRRNASEYQQVLNRVVGDESAVAHTQPKPVKGYRLFNYYQFNRKLSSMDLEVFALKALENQRIVTRIAPMLGLVATMIPMGPALKALADGNIQGISENLVIAFAAVIFGLATASITFWTVSVKKRWFVSELNDLQVCLTRNHPSERGEQ
ncbi:MAG: MotA/TolQ/ExbB proton channel family protein [Pseudomonadales bacterium]|nr:MotA/TolQ/ExbB proton channel family protein [Pseudomonadales bacterium]